LLNNLELVTDIDARFSDRTGGEFQNIPRLEVDSSHSERSETVPQLDHPQLSIQRHYIDGKAHAEGVNT
jgi:hypothetical protein